MTQCTALYVQSLRKKNIFKNSLDLTFYKEKVLINVQSFHLICSICWYDRFR